MEWVEVEDDKDMINAIIDDEVEILETETQPTADSVLAVEDDEESDVEAIDLDEEKEEDLVTFLEAEEAVNKLSKSCKGLGVPEEATVHLDRFKRALLKAKLNKKTKSTTLHDFFKPQKRAKSGQLLSGLSQLD